jgi:hypothetical protein
MEESLEEVAAEQNRVLEVKVETRIEVGTSSQRPCGFIGIKTEGDVEDYRT